MAMYVTGIGCIGSLGEGVQSLAAMDSSVVPTPGTMFTESQLVDTQFYQGDLSNDIAASSYMMALKACQEALNDSAVESNNIALVVATGAGDTDTIESDSNSSDSPYDVTSKLMTALGIGGVYATVSNACSSAGYALSVCEDLLEEGHAAVLLCGVEAKSITTQSAFKLLLVLDPISCRPFSEDRKGTVLGCGAAALLLVGSALNQKKIYASILGNALSCDAFHLTAPEPNGTEMRRTIQEALDKSSLSPADVKMFIPHATGTALNDKIEKDILKSVFFDTYSVGSIYLIKQYIGHTGGASAAFSYVVASMILYRFSKNGKNINALINCTAFGGNNSSALFSAYFSKKMSKN